MTNKEMKEVRDSLLDIIDEIRKAKPEIWFDLTPLQWGEDQYHLEVKCTRRIAHFGQKIEVIKKDLITMDWGKKILIDRTFDMLKKSQQKELEHLKGVIFERLVG